MNNDLSKLNLKTLKAQGLSLIRKLRPYSLLIFIVFVAVLYGFVIFRVNSLAGAEPSPNGVTDQVKAARLPHIDQKVVDQLKSLQDNSVNVQALFEEARNNPFE